MTKTNLKQIIVNVNIDCCDHNGNCDCPEDDPNPVVNCCDDLNLCQSNKDKQVCCNGECAEICAIRASLVTQTNPLTCCTKTESCQRFNKVKTTCCIDLNDPC